MKYSIPVIASILLVFANAIAGTEDIIGSFKGTEKSTLTNCGAYDGTTTGAWSITHSNLNGASFTGKGSNKDGDFTSAGEVSDTAVKGTVKGVNKWGQAWSGDFTGSIDGNKYMATTNGSVATGCKFVSEVEATKN